MGKVHFNVLYVMCQGASKSERTWAYEGLKKLQLSPASGKLTLPTSRHLMSIVVSCFFVSVLVLFFPLNPLWKHLHLLILQGTFLLLFLLFPKLSAFA